MSATNAFETALLGLIFTNANVANVGDATGLRGATSAGVFWVSLHTSTGPGETGDQTTNEANYTDYGRVSVARDTDEWTVTNNEVVNDNPIAFPAASAGSSTCTYFGLGSAQTSTGNLNIYGELTSPLAVSTGITPSFAAGDLSVTLD